MSQATILAFMYHQQLTENEATVTTILTETLNGMTCVQLDATIFYPQGGGQLCDTGTISNGKGSFDVKGVRFTDGLVHHYGSFSQGSFSVGDKVMCRIDDQRRHHNSRLHSAGHLLDEAVKNLGLAWVPTKGIHYPDQAAVEYAGTLDNTDEIKMKLENETNRLVDGNADICANLVAVGDLPALSDYIPPDLPADKPVRIVNMGGVKSTPCGGTHVKTTKDIGHLKIRYIKAKKGNIKVAYELTDN